MDLEGQRMTTRFSDDILAMGRLGAGARPAVVDMNGVWSWDDLGDAVARAEELLGGLDLPARARVLLLGPDSIWHQVVLMACANLGLIFTPISNRYARVEIERALALTAPSVGLLDPRSIQLFADTGLRSTGATLGPLEVVSWDVERIPDLSAVSTRRQPILITLTSGSTAAPKAVLFSREGETAVSRLHASTWRLNPHDTVLSAPPFSWIYGLSTVSLGTLISGAGLVVPERFSPAVICDLAEGRDVTAFIGVTTHFRIIVDYCEKTGRRPFGPALRMAISGGERRDEAVFARFEELFGVPVLDLYASSEVRPGFGYDPLISPRPVAGSCGRLISGVEAKVSDLADGLEGGTLSLRAPGNFMGYFDKDHLVVDEVGPQDWIEMGDRFRLDDDWGFVVGRTKDVIIRGGANVSPTEVEGVLSEHDDVVEAVVFGVESTQYGEAVAAAVVGEFEDVGDLRSRLGEHAGRQLAAFKVPTEWLLVERLPRNANDKVDTPRLRQMVSGRLPA
jgi:long-chain acyl-CoA synthetase